MGADYSPVPQEDAAPAANVVQQNAATAAAMEDLRGTLNEVDVQIRRASLWVFYMILIQLLASFWFPDSLLFYVNLFVNFLGTLGVRRRNRGLISLHFGWTIGINCVSWFIVFYTMFYAFTYSLLALAFCMVQTVGLRHERNLLSLVCVAPSTPLSAIVLVQSSAESEAQNQSNQNQKQNEQNQTQSQPEVPSPFPPSHVMPMYAPMPSFVYAPYGQQFPTQNMEQAMYPGMYPQYYPFPQGFPNMPSMPMPSYPQPPFNYAPFQAPVQAPVATQESEQEKQ